MKSVRKASTQYIIYIRILRGTETAKDRKHMGLNLFIIGHVKYNENRECMSIFFVPLNCKGSVHVYVPSQECNTQSQ
jgi:hypothetical protein